MADVQVAAAAAGLIPAPLRPMLRSLSLSARLPPPPGPLGQNASRRRGQGLEFSQYRAYEPGDEPRHIDWKLFARSDRYFVREAESEAGLSLWVVVDATASMAQADHDDPARNKRAAAQCVAAAAIEVALRQGDRFGLLLAGGDGLQWVDSGRGPRHRDRCVHALARIGCRGTWPALEQMRPVWQRIEPASVVLMIGDGFDAAATALARQLAATRRDVRSLVLTCVDERDFALRGAHVFEDPESGLRIEADAAEARAGFRARFAAARAALARDLAACGVCHLEHVLDQAWLPTLAALFAPGRRR